MKGLPGPSPDEGRWRSVGHVGLAEGAGLEGRVRSSPGRGVDGRGDVQEEVGVGACCSGGPSGLSSEGLEAVQGRRGFKPRHRKASCSASARPL